MTIYEKIAETKNTTVLTTETAQSAYTKAENDLTSYIGDYVVNAKIKHPTYGIGTITSYRKNGTLACLLIKVDFETVTKQLSLSFFINNFIDLPDIVDIWTEAFAVHTELTKTYTEITTALEKAETEAKQKAAEEKKAAEKYERQKAKVMAEFDNLAKTPKIKNAADEFYYALGWLAKNIGAVSAALPDYLLDSFERYFGTEAHPTVVDSKKKTSGGNTMQWTLSMRASISKKAKDFVPACLVKYLNPAKTALTNTSFIWDLVDNYGFYFGKTQDIEKIRECVPTANIYSFEAGLVA